MKTKINNPCKQVRTNTTDLYEVIENIIPTLKNRRIKIKVNYPSNILFHVLPMAFIL